MSDEKHDQIMSKLFDIEGKVTSLSTSALIEAARREVAEACAQIAHDKMTSTALDIETLIRERFLYVK